MTKPAAKLIYDPSTGKLVYDPATGKLVYNGALGLTGSLYHDSFSVREGVSDVSVADALVDMKSAPWYNAGYHSGAYSRSAWIPSTTNYNMRYGCVRWEMAPFRSIAGEVVKGIKFNLTRYKFGTTVEPTWRVGYRFSNNTVPEDDWAWADEAPSITGTGTGVQLLPVANEVALNYLYLICTNFPYVDLAPDLSTTDIIAGKDNITIIF